MDLELWSALPPVHWWAMPTLPCGTLVTGNELDSVTRIEPHASKLAKERERALNPYILYDPVFCASFFLFPLVFLLTAIFVLFSAVFPPGFLRILDRLGRGKYQKIRGNRQELPEIAEKETIIMVSLCM
jgi:hypothetical protein